MDTCQVWNKPEKGSNEIVFFKLQSKEKDSNSNQ